VKLLAGAAVFVAGGVLLAALGPYGDEDDSLVAVLAVTPAVLAGVIAARWSAVLFALLIIPPGLVLIENGVNDLSTSFLYSSLVVEVLVVAGLIAIGVALGQWLGSRRKENQSLQPD
jgi:hypothetical protein